MIDLKQDRIIYKDSNHSYTDVRTGKKVRSVTAVLSFIPKPVLVPWAAKKAAEKIVTLFKPDTVYGSAEIAAMSDQAKQAPKEEKEESARLGTEIHHLVEEYILTGKAPKKHPDPSVLRGTNNFIFWAKQHKIEWLLSEQLVYFTTPDDSEVLWAGTMDFLALVDGVLELDDLKTGNAIYLEYDLQTAAYLRGLHQMLERDPKLRKLHPALKDFDPAKITRRIVRPDKLKDAKTWGEERKQIIPYGPACEIFDHLAAAQMGMSQYK